MSTMRGSIRKTLGVTAVVVGFGLTTTGVAFAGQDKIAFCHNDNNLHLVETSVQAFFNAGHIDHAGDIWPAFEYTENGPDGAVVQVPAQGDQSLLSTGCVKPTPTESESPSPSPSESDTSTPTPSESESETPTPTPSESDTSTPTPSASESETPTPTPSASVSVTPTPSQTATSTVRPTPRHTHSRGTESPSAATPVATPQGTPSGPTSLAQTGSNLPLLAAGAGLALLLIGGGAVASSATARKH